MRQFKLLLAVLASAAMINPADAHGTLPNFPVHHARLFLFGSHPVGTGSSTDFGKSLSGLLGKGGIGNIHSGTLFSFGTGGKQYSNFVGSAFAAGAGPRGGPSSSFSGGAVAGGTLQGDLYVLDRPTMPGVYFNLGEFTSTVGSNIPATVPTQAFSLFGGNSTTPNFQNSLTFLSPNMFAGFGRTSGLWRNSFAAGERIGGGTSNNVPVTGGVFAGTAYRNTQGSSTYTSNSFFASGAASNSPQYLFAVGNSPLNNPGAINSTTNIPSPTSFVLFGNGVNKPITNGQILYPIITPSGQFGTAFTMAGNPANTGILNQPLSNLSNFLFF